MIIVEKNEGVKINYSVDGTKLTLNDEMTLDLSKYERDFPVHNEVQNGTDEEGNPKIEMVLVPFDMSKVILTLWSLEG